MNLTQGRKLAIRNFINPVMTICVVSFGQVIRAIIIKQVKFCFPKIQGFGHPDSYRGSDILIPKFHSTKPF